MLDPNAAIGAGLAAFASKDLLTKLLGPTADYVGGEIRGLVEKCNLNVEAIFQKMFRKVGQKIAETGEVNPRVVKNALDDGKFCDEEMLAEYYAGILASSRTTNSRDDVGVSHLATVKALSVYQVRLHYLFYRELHRIFSPTQRTLSLAEDRTKLGLFIPFDVFLAVEEFRSDEDPNVILTHAVTGLVRHELVGQNWKCGPVEFIKKHFPRASKGGLLLEPSLQGAELFIWANGKCRVSAAEFLIHPVVDLDVKQTIPDGTVSSKESV